MAIRAVHGHHGCATGIADARRLDESPGVGALDVAAGAPNRLDDGKLLREHWLVLDATLEPEPVKRVLLEGVNSLKFRFLDDARSWRDTWPPPSGSATRSEKDYRWRPTAVEVTIELKDWGQIKRIIEVPG